MRCSNLVWKWCRNLSFHHGSSKPPRYNVRDLGQGRDHYSQPAQEAQCFDSGPLLQAGRPLAGDCCSRRHIYHRSDRQRPFLFCVRTRPCTRGCKLTAVQRGRCRLFEDHSRERGLLSTLATCFFRQQSCRYSGFLLTSEDTGHGAQRPCGGIVCCPDSAFGFHICSSTCLPIDPLYFAGSGRGRWSKCGFCSAVGNCQGK